jgi:ubiquinone biosynthesis protein UbiJ
MEKVKHLMDELGRLERKLVGGLPVPMTELNKTHAEIRRIKEEIARLERRVGRV